MVPLLVDLVGVVGGQVVLAVVRDVVVVGVPAVGIGLRLHVVQQERLQVVGHLVAVAVGVRNAVVVPVVARKDPVRVIGDRGVVGTRAVPVADVGIAVVVVVVLHEAAVVLLGDGEQLAPRLHPAPAPPPVHVIRPRARAAARPVPAADPPDLPVLAVPRTAVGKLPVLDAAGVLPAHLGVAPLPGPVQTPQGPARPLPQIQAHPLQVRHVPHVAPGPADRGYPRRLLSLEVAAGGDQGVAADAVVELVVLHRRGRDEQRQHLEAIVVAHQRLHLNLADEGLLAHVEDGDDLLMAVGAMPRNVRQDLHPAHQLLHVDLVRHVLPLQVVAQVEHVREARAPIQVDGAPELTREPVGGAHRRGILAVDPGQEGPQVRPVLPVDPETDLGDHGPGLQVLRRVVGEPHQVGHRQHLLGLQPPAQLEALLLRVEDVEVHPRRPQGQRPQLDVAVGPKKHRRTPDLLGRVPVVPGRTAAVAGVGVRPGPALSDDGHPGVAHLAVQADAVVPRQGQRQRREEGADLLPVDQARRPTGVRFAGHQVALEAPPTGDPARRLVPVGSRRRPGFTPFIHVVTLDQVVAQGAVVVAPGEARELRQRVVLETVVLVGRV